VGRKRPVGDVKVNHWLLPLDEEAGQAADLLAIACLDDIHEGGITLELSY